VKYVTLMHYSVTLTSKDCYNLWSKSVTMLDTKSSPNENKYKDGQVVYAIADPSRKLIVRRYASRLYYCKIQDSPASDELVYYERELTADKA
jgi:hypothetical protein